MTMTKGPPSPSLSTMTSTDGFERKAGGCERKFISGRVEIALWWGGGRRGERGVREFELRVRKLRPGRPRGRGTYGGW